MRASQVGCDGAGEGAAADAAGSPWAGPEAAGAELVGSVRAGAGVIGAAGVALGLDDGAGVSLAGALGAESAGACPAVPSTVNVPDAL